MTRSPCLLRNKPDLNSCVLAFTGVPTSTVFEYNVGNHYSQTDEIGNDDEPRINRHISRY